MWNRSSLLWHFPLPRTMYLKITTSYLYGVRPGVSKGFDVGRASLCLWAFTHQILLTVGSESITLTDTRRSTHSSRREPHHFKHVCRADRQCGAAPDDMHILHGEHDFFTVEHVGSPDATRGSHTGRRFARQRARHHADQNSPHVLSCLARRTGPL